MSQLTSSQYRSVQDIQHKSSIAVLSNYLTFTSHKVM